LACCAGEMVGAAERGRCRALWLVKMRDKDLVGGVGMVRGFAIVGLEDVTSDYASRIKSTNSSAGESSLTSWYTEFACWQ